MDEATGRCCRCDRVFEVRFTYQVQLSAGGYVYYCSQSCQQEAFSAWDGCACEVCQTRFTLEYAHQIVMERGRTRYFCSTECRVEAARRGPAHDGPVRARRIAVFNHKGGTGKTTTAVNLAAGLAERGERVLLVDADGQGNVGTSLGIRGERSLYHVLVHGALVEEVAVPVRDGLDVICSNESLASAELHLAGRPNRDRILCARLGERAAAYDTVVVDCAPALSLMNQNALVYADSVLIPVSCDYLSLVGVRQVLRTLKSVRDVLDHDVQLLGVLPTFFDVRNRIARQTIETLEEHFGERCLPPIRVNTRLREAPAARKTIFEYAPRCRGAEDYRRLVTHIREMGAGHGRRDEGSAGWGGGAGRPAAELLPVAPAATSASVV